MSIDLSLLTLPATGAAIYFIVKLAKKKFAKPETAGLDYIKKGDLTAQVNYDDQYKEKNPLTKDEKIEVSWQFLYDITDTVLNKFNTTDKEAIHQLGHKLLDNGTGYEHVIEYGLKPKKKMSRLTEEMEKDLGTTEVKR